MALDIVVKSLLKVELFADLKPLQVAEIARRSDRIVYAAGQAIITEGAVGDAAILIVKGEVVRVAGPALSLPAEPVAEGSLVGEMAMLVEARHTSTVVARAPTRAIRITRTAMLEQIESDPRLADHLSTVLARRLRHVAGQLRRFDDTLGRLDRPFEMPAMFAKLLPPAHLGLN